MPSDKAGSHGYRDNRPPVNAYPAGYSIVFSAQHSFCRHIYNCVCECVAGTIYSKFCYLSGLAKVGFRFLKSLDKSKIQIFSFFFNFNNFFSEN